LSPIPAQFRATEGAGQMQITSETPRVARSIGGTNEQNAEVRVTVQVPQPYAAGPRELTEGEASNALNQIVAENLSNNLRAKIVGGQTDAEGNVTASPHRRGLGPGPRRRIPRRVRARRSSDWHRRAAGHRPRRARGPQDRPREGQAGRQGRRAASRAITTWARSPRPSSRPTRTC
jgi:hypothetical protein